MKPSLPNFGVGGAHCCAETTASSHSAQPVPSMHSLWTSRLQSGGVETKFLPALQNQKPRPKEVNHSSWQCLEVKAGLELLSEPITGHLPVPYQTSARYVFSFRDVLKTGKENEAAVG